MQTEELTDTQDMLFVEALLECVSLAKNDSVCSAVIQARRILAVLDAKANLLEARIRMARAIFDIVSSVYAEGMTEANKLLCERLERGVMDFQTELRRFYGEQIH